MDAPILMPDLVRQFGNMFVQKPIASDGANTFKAGAFVYLVAGVLTLVPSDGVLVYGQTPDKSHAATEYPPEAIFGENHWVFSPLDAEFEINVGVVTAGALVVGEAGNAAQVEDVVLGGAYGIATATSGAHAGFQFLDPTETAATLFIVTGFVDNVTSTAYNGRVRVKIIPSKVQP